MKYLLLCAVALIVSTSPAAAQSYQGWRDMRCGPGTWPCPTQAADVSDAYPSSAARCRAERDTSSAVCNAGCHYLAKSVREDTLCDVTREELAAACKKETLLFGVCGAAR